jgi:hypothetical protein
VVSATLVTRDFGASATCPATRPDGSPPLTRGGRRRLCERVDGGRPIANVAAEARVVRCLAKWYAPVARDRL